MLCLFALQIHIATVSYQYMSSLFYRETHLLRFICCYCTSVYKKCIILLCFIFNYHRNLLISHFFNQFICNIFRGYFLMQTSKSTTSQKLRIPTCSKHLKKELYQGLADSGEGDHNSDLNHLDSVIISKYTTVTNQC